MKLYTTPNTTTLEDGSIKINVQAITPEYIENHIKNIEAVEKLDINEVISIIRGSNNLDEANNSLYEKYATLASAENNVIFGGRLAEYKYYDMAPIMERAFLLSEKV